MISMEDHRKPDGTLDWNSYHRAQIAAGDRCESCGAYIVKLSRDPPGPQRCHDCRSISRGTGEETHERLIRCPKCRATHTADYETFGSIHEEGEHKVWCPTCEHEFEISTHVSFRFKSPALIQEEEPEEEEDDDGEEEE